MNIQHPETRVERPVPALTQANIDLAAKYARPGPRYTSYPAAPYFDDPDAIDRYRNLRLNSDIPDVAPLSLYVHVPFCRDICYYCACNKIVTRDKAAGTKYLDYLEKEVALQGGLGLNRRPITQLHWGGGTPTFLEDAELTRLMHLLASHFHLVDSGDREYSVEIDPRRITSDTIALLKGLGFNRISLGIQDFDPLVQKSINRIQSYEMVAGVVGTIRSLGFSSLSFDLIYGLPHQDEDSIVETMRKVLSLGPDRIACYNYAHLPTRFSSQRAIDRLTLPDPEAKLRLHALIAATLEDAGYIHIGMDHFVKPQDELARAQRTGRLQRNFQGYSLRKAEDLLGLGVSAISQMGDFYLQNEREIPAYYARLDANEPALTKGYRMTAEDKLRRHVIMSLACQLQLDIDDCEARFDIRFDEHFAAALPQLDAMQEDGLVQRDGSRLRITPAGRPFIRNICMLFDAYLDTAPRCEAAPRYSATI